MAKRASAQAGRQAKAAQPRQQILAEPLLPAKKMGAAGDVQPQPRAAARAFLRRRPPAQRIKRGPGAVAPHPVGQFFQRGAVRLRITLAGHQFGAKRAAIGQRQPRRHAGGQRRRGNRGQKKAGAVLSQKGEGPRRRRAGRARPGNRILRRRGARPPGWVALLSAALGVAKLAPDTLDIPVCLILRIL